MMGQNQASSGGDGGGDISMIWRSGQRQESFRKQNEQALMRGSRCEGLGGKSRILVPLTDIRQTRGSVGLGQ